MDMPALRVDVFAAGEQEVEIFFRKKRSDAEDLFQLEGLCLKVLLTHTGLQPGG